MRVGGRNVLVCLCFFLHVLTWRLLSLFLFSCSICDFDKINLTSPQPAAPSKGLTYSVVWILRDLEHMDEITRDYAVGVTDPDRRRLLLLPWQPIDLISEHGISPQPKPVNENFFRVARKNETLPSPTVSPSLPVDRKIRVYAEYGE